MAINFNELSKIIKKTKEKSQIGNQNFGKKGLSPINNAFKKKVFKESERVVFDAIDNDDSINSKNNTKNIDINIVNLKSRLSDYTNLSKKTTNKNKLPNLDENLLKYIPYYISN